MASKGIKNINMMILSIKIILTAMFFNTTIEFVAQELKRDKKLRKFFKIDEVPSAIQISEFLSRFKPYTYVKIVKQDTNANKTFKKDVENVHLLLMPHP
jgi:hypothetical protein